MGVIISYNKKAGFGLIKDENQERIIFSKSEVPGTPLRGMLVSFDIGLDSGTLCAINIKVVNYLPAGEFENYISHLQPYLTR